ncbi:hypothetical protein DPMN_098380 [Dreissena polymorpha]|uniref:Uncharacterized protein n=1 Tax=Dreissena polymorpha TaxID=45954 RepID=A0A9D4R5F5_DREPO|nr:hypothetical protein DPMN_098380 [Dreissena polymorpha]
MGPSMEPWGTPQKMFSDDEKLPDTSTGCFLSDKYDCNHFVISSLRPEARSFIKSMEWSPESKAFCKSKRTMPLNLPLSFSPLIKSDK